MNSALHCPLPSWPDSAKIIGSTLIRKLHEKFSDVPEVEVAIATTELLRFMQLCIAKDGSLFFTGSKLVDDIWHSMIVETREYQDLCEKLAPGTFLHHSGMKADDYFGTRSQEQGTEELLSWLTSYISSFGDITNGQLPHIASAKFLMRRLSLDLEGLNKMGRTLLILSKQLDAQCDTSIFSNSNFSPSQFRNKPSIVKQEIQTLLRTQSFHSESNANEELTKIFAKSSTLAFTLWQHLSAIERIENAHTWKSIHTELYADLTTGKQLVGLATTHLAKPKSPVTGIKNDLGYLVSGVAPWVSGLGIFDYLILGFKTDLEVVFCLTPFPQLQNLHRDIKVSRVSIPGFDGTGTVILHFEDLQIEESQIISRRLIDSPNIPKKSRYQFPELGIAMAALNELDAIQTTDHHSPLIQVNTEQLRNRILQLQNESHVTADVSAQKDELIRSCVRMLGLIAGGSGLKEGSKFWDLHQDLALLDAWIQPVTVKNLKLKSCL